MKEPIDNFSQQSATYKKFRPTYPASFYEAILGLSPERGACWDCGTGNGQVAQELAKHFAHVYATDISASQLEHAVQKENIHYRVERAEQTSFADGQFDLVTVAQAVHWFDFGPFYKEVRRVSKNGALLCIWGYGLLRISPEIDALLDTFYQEITGPYWNAERRHIDGAYADIGFDFQEIQLKEAHCITTDWTLPRLAGYLNSWSAVQHYLEQNGESPVPKFITALEKVWPSHRHQRVVFPIFSRIGRVGK